MYPPGPYVCKRSGFGHIESLLPVKYCGEVITAMLDDIEVEISHILGEDIAVVTFKGGIELEKSCTGILLC